MNESRLLALCPGGFAHPLQRVAANIVPLLDTPGETMRLIEYPELAPDRHRPENLIRDVYRRRYGARVEEFYPMLLAFEAPSGLHAALGLRDGCGHRFFSEHYLDGPAEIAVGARAGGAVERSGIVEVGNLAVTHRGQTRWLIAALTAYLHAAGYRWVLFTLVPELFNAFHRMGMFIVELGEADPACLPDRGACWGSYYAQRPRVCAGDIRSGFHTLSIAIGAGSSQARRLWQDAGARGAAERMRPRAIQGAAPG